MMELETKYIELIRGAGSACLCANDPYSKEINISDQIPDVPIEEKIKICEHLCCKLFRAKTFYFLPNSSGHILSKWRPCRAPLRLPFIGKK